MKIEKEVQEKIHSIQSGEFDKISNLLGEKDLGIYIPCYVEGETVKMMPNGFSQIETNLDVRVTTDQREVPEGSKAVAWMKRPSQIGDGATVQCKHCLHSDIQSCKHCSGHPTDDENRRFRHPNTTARGPFDADELDYESALEDLRRLDPTLIELGKKGLGLSLLHAHNDIYEFTTLPVGYVSVIIGPKTQFRTIEEVNSDTSFIPNTWRYIDGNLHIAAGFSTRANQSA